MALVSCGNGRRVVALASDIDPEPLRCGDMVYLDSDQTVLVARSRSERPQGGEMAMFERYTGDGRIVLKSRGEARVEVEAAAALDDTALRPGDPVRWASVAALFQG